jgi:hemoglobin-like flavoprotein
MALQVELLEQSFEKVKPKATEFAASFYNHLFTDYPAAKPLFEHVNMSEQQGKLLKSLVLVVENLRKPDTLSQALKGLGSRHVSYGTLSEHYPLVGSTLLKTFEEYLGSDWTPEVKQAWSDAYGAITEIMLEGAKETEAKEQEASPKPEASEGDLQVDLLEQSFEKVKPKATEFAASFYNHLFTDYPAAKPLFEHVNMAEQQGKLLKSLVLVVENLRKPDVLSQALKGLGSRHVSYGTLSEHYPLVGSTLLKTFEEYLGSDWTPEVKRAWSDAYGAITEIMLEGAKETEASQPPRPAATPTATSPATTPAPDYAPVSEGDVNFVSVLAGFGIGGIVVGLLALLF